MRWDKYMFNNMTVSRLDNVSHRARSKGKKTVQCTHCALETEIVGFYQAQLKLHFYIYGARKIFGFVDHQPFPQTYHKKDLSELSPRMRKLMLGGGKD